MRCRRDTNLEDTIGDEVVLGLMSFGRGKTYKPLARERGDRGGSVIMHGFSSGMGGEVHCQF